MNRAAFLFLVLLPLPALAASPGPVDFAWKSSLSFPPGGALYEVSIPLFVYRGIRSPELADICIFNGRDEIVPFSVTTPPPPPIRKQILLPHFPLPDKSTPGEKLSIQVERRPSGEIVTVSSGKAVTPPTAYLVDATSATEPIESLVLEWRDTPEGFIEQVSVESSDDLEQWRPVTTATLASLHRDGGTVVQRQIPLSGIKTRYLRLMPQGNRSAVEFTSVVAALSAGIAEPARERLAVAPRSAASGQPGEYLFDISGSMPVDRLRVLLPERNSLARGIIFSRPGESAPWVRRQEGLLYRISTRDGELVSPELSVPASGDRYWRLKVGEAGGGVGAAAVTVEVAWIPHRIHFLPRGEAPFILAFGSGRADTRSVRGADLLAGLPASEATKVGLVRAQVGEAVPLAGKAALKKEISSVTRKKLLLWGMLITGVGVLAWMALRLIRQMRREDG